VFDAGHPDQKEEGARVYKVEVSSGKRNSTSSHVLLCKEAVLSFGRGDIDFSRIHLGDKIWKTSDPELEQRLARTFEGDVPRFQRLIAISAHGVLDKPLTVIAKDELGHIVKVQSEMPLLAAQKQPLTTERLRDQLGRLGGTPFKLGDLDNQIEGELLIPVSELNRLRREIVDELIKQRSEPPRWRCEVSGDAGKKEASVVKPALSQARLIVLVRNLSQLKSVIESGIETVYCEFEDPKKYRDAVSFFRQSAIGNRQSAIYVAPPRIFKMGEEWTLKQVLSSGADGYLVRNYDHLKVFAEHRRVGDFSLNIANHLAADYFKNKFGLERVTASYDLNHHQLEALLKVAPPEWFEITIHQHIPMFHMEHCVFCAFLSKGTDYTNCGRPCDKHDLKLRDRVGAEHPVKADVGCRNTVFNALAQTGAEHVPALLSLGVRNFRLEFLNESPETVAKTIQRYHALLRGEITGAQLWRELKLLNQLGVTRGQM
jgi:putative protease